MVRRRRKIGRANRRRYGLDLETLIEWSLYHLLLTEVLHGGGMCEGGQIGVCLAVSRYSEIDGSTRARNVVSECRREDGRDSSHGF